MRRGDVVEVVLPAQTTVDVVEQTTSLIEVPLATVRGPKGDAATVAVGSVTTGEPGTAASVVNSGTPGSAIFDFVIPRGDKGEQGERGATGATGATGAQGAKGDAGEAATVTVGSVETGAEGTPVIITNSGTATHAVFNFRIPVGATGAQGIRGLKGDTGEQGERGEQGLPGATGAQGERGEKGEQGNAATVTIGTVRTGAAGSSASVTNSGTSSNAVFNFVIPAGAQGLPGEKGEKGETGEAGAKGDKGDPGTPGEKGDKGDKGDTGAAGHTPVRGTDYWTAADQAAIVSDVQASLGDLAMQDTITHTQVSDWNSATSSFLTEHQSLDGLATETYVDNAIAAITDADSKSY